ncbi:MAG: hypothetical protein ACJ8GJ_25555 [Vitreoscilla sp.]
MPHLPEAGSAPQAVAQLLKSRNIGILCNDPERPELLLLQEEVRGLGARTALVRPDLGDEAEPSAIDRAARLLALLYDAIICIDLPASSVVRMRDSSRIPVISDLPLAGIVGAGPSAEALASLRQAIVTRLLLFPA